MVKSLEIGPLLYYTMRRIVILDIKTESPMSLLTVCSILCIPLCEYTNQSFYFVELAHQWFGNLVTMDWWNELWLNEGFATWVGWLAVDKFYPGIHDLELLSRRNR